MVAMAMRVHPEQRCLKGRLEANFDSLHFYRKMNEGRLKLLENFSVY
jgi:hypothetical protein